MTDAAVISFLSSKGGSGKTVVASSLGTFLSGLGFKVLLIDTDAATNGMTLLFLEQLLNWKKHSSAITTRRTGLFDATDDQPADKLSITENLEFIPATYLMSDTEEVDKRRFESSLHFVLQSRDNYDFVFLDAQAGADHYARVAAEASTICVLVSEYDPVSTQGIERLKILLGNILEPSRTLTLFNKVLPEFAKLIGEGLSVARYLPPIPWDIDVVRAFAARDLAVDIKSPNAFTIAIAQLALALDHDFTYERIAEWQDMAADSVIEPAQRKKQEIEEAIEELLRDAKIQLVLTLSNIIFGLCFFLSAIGISELFLLPRIYSVVVGSLGAMLVALGGVRALSPKRGADRALAELRQQHDHLTAMIDAKMSAMRFSVGGIFGSLRRSNLLGRHDTR